MRELIKEGAYTFTTDSTRKITITDGRAFAKNDVLVLINETQKVVIASSMLKDNIVSVIGNVITFSNSLPALATGDILSIFIDYPQNEMVVISHTQPVNFITLSSTINVQQTGILLSYGTTTSLFILRIGASSYVPLTLPALVVAGESINATVASIGIQNMVIQKSSTSSPILNAGSLAAKTLNGGCTFAYYSTFLSKILIGGLAVFDEDGCYRNGDGNAGWYGTIGQAFYNKHALEYNGKLYYYSIERGVLIELDLSSGSVRGILACSTVYQIEAIGNNLYVSSAISSTYAVRVIDLTTLSTTSFSWTSNASTFIPMYSDGVSIYFANNTGSVTYKLTGTTLVTSTGGGVANYYPYTISVGDYVYMHNASSLYKFNKSDMTWVATLAVGAGGTTSPNNLFKNADGTYIYVLSATGIVFKVSATTFTVVTSINIGISDTKFASVEVFNEKAYIISGNGTGSDIGKTFAAFNMPTDTSTLYAPPTSGLNFNTHNALNIDTVNNRLIFFGVNKSGVNYYNVEIVNIP